MNDPILSLRNVCKAFGGVVVIAGVSFDIARGEKLGIIGPNGSGKTTLMNCITGVVRSDKGDILFSGDDISSLAVHQRARRGIARTFQIPRPFVGISVAENVRVPLDYTKTSCDRAARGHELLALVGLEGHAERPAESLSQLELRKLELARALASEPQLLIVDEVMAGLAESEIDDVLGTLFRLNDLGVTVVMIEHIMHAIMRFSKRLICLETGRVIADGTPEEVADNPEVRRVYFGQQADG